MRLQKNEHRYSVSYFIFTRINFNLQGGTMSFLNEQEKKEIIELKNRIHVLENDLQSLHENCSRSHAIMIEEKEARDQQLKNIVGELNGIQERLDQNSIRTRHLEDDSTRNMRVHQEILKKLGENDSEIKRIDAFYLNECKEIGKEFARIDDSFVHKDDLPPADLQSRIQRNCWIECSECSPPAGYLKVRCANGTEIKIKNIGDTYSEYANMMKQFTAWRALTIGEVLSFSEKSNFISTGSQC